MRISIITATFNSCATIESAIVSVLGQSHKDIEHIVIDGASTDGTLRVIEKYKSRISKVVSERDGGLYYALNKGLALAKGDIIGFLHADDVYAADDVFEKLTASFVQSHADAVYGDLAYIKKDGSTLRHWRAGEYDAAALEGGWMPPHPTFFVKREIYQRYGAFNTDFKISADYDLMMRFLYVHKIRATYLPELLVRMRVGGVSNGSVANVLQKSLEDYRVIRKCALGGVVTLLKKNFSKIPQFF
ncbi:MAG: glycosyltransferase family 2 protein [Elusimicrobiota bacterium]